MREGLKCRLVLEERVAGSFDPDGTGNNFLFDLLGVEQVTVVQDGANLPAAMATVAADLAAEGRRGYVIPGGGSNALGALGYVTCAEELLWQQTELGVAFDHIVCASGSAGTHAGLAVGLHKADAGIPLTGISVRRPTAEQEPNVLRLAQDTARLLELSQDVPADAIRVRDEWVGPGYSIPTDAMAEAVRLASTLEGVLLDPVYTGQGVRRADRHGPRGRIRAHGQCALPPYRRQPGALCLSRRAGARRAPPCGRGARACRRRSHAGIEGARWKRSWSGAGIWTRWSACWAAWARRRQWISWRGCWWPRPPRATRIISIP